METTFDRTYEGLKPLAGLWWWVLFLPFDRTYEGLKRFPLLGVFARHMPLLTVPMRV